MYVRTTICAYVYVTFASAKVVQLKLKHDGVLCHENHRDLSASNHIIHIQGRRGQGPSFQFVSIYL